MMKIARVLNSQGVFRESGKPGSGQWHQAKLWELPQNPAYVGLLVAGDELVQGSHDLLIDEETWERTKAIVASRRKQAPRSKASPHLLSRFVRCGKCHRAMVGQKAKYRNSQCQQIYYAFRHPPNDYSDDIYCPGTYHRGDTLEEAVAAEILELANDPKVFESALATAQERLKNEDTSIKDEMSGTGSVVSGIGRSPRQANDRRGSIQAA